MLGLIVTAAIALAGFVTSRNYVRSRLRFVDAVQKPTAPLIAGLLFGVIAWPFGWVLPIAHITAALAAGVSVGIGVASGARDIRRGNAGLLEP